MFRFFLRKSARNAADREKIARLETAERELASLKARAASAITTLGERQDRNHWRQSIEQIITGGHH